MPKIMEKINGGKNITAISWIVESILISDKVMKINQYEWA
jgi:hypothetical protein